MSDFSEHIVSLLLLLSLSSCFEIIHSYFFPLEKKELKDMFIKPSDDATVWQLYTSVGDGPGRITIGIFEDAKQGLDFIRSFGFDQNIYCTTNNTKGDDNDVSYSVEFTAREAIEKGFLNMYAETGNSRRELVHILYLDEVELNRQLVHDIGEDDC